MCARLSSRVVCFAACVDGETGESEYVQKYRMLIANFYFHYAMLTINAFGLQNALERSAVDIGHFFARCHSSAISCATILRDEMGPSGYLQYAPDSHFVMGSYAAVRYQVRMLKSGEHIVGNKKRRRKEKRNQELQEKTSKPEGRKEKELQKSEKYE